MPHQYILFMHADEHDRCAWTSPRNQARRLNPIQPRHCEIQDGAIGVQGFRLLHSRLAVRGLRAHTPTLVAKDKLSQIGPNWTAVIGDQELFYCAPGFSLIVHGG